MRLRGPAGTLLLVFWMGSAILFAGSKPYVEGDVLEFHVHDLQGRPFSSDDDRFRDKLVFLDLWGTWCPPCLTEIPTFNDLQSRYGQEGLLIVGMAFERLEDAEERRAHLRAAVEEQGIDYLVLDGGAIADFEKTLGAMRDVGGFPIEIIIDREGKVADVRNSSGYKKRWARKLEAELRERLGIAEEH